MPSTNNNTNWKKRSGSVYQQELSLDKYDDPDNSIDKRKGTVIVRTDIETEVQYLEKTTTGVGQEKNNRTLMQLSLMDQKHKLTNTECKIFWFW